MCVCFMPLLSAHQSVIVKHPTYNTRRPLLSEDRLTRRRCRALQACLQAFTDLVEAVARDPTQRRNLPDDAAVHPLSSNVLRAVKRIMRFRRGYEELVQNVKMPWDMSGDSSTLQVGGGGGNRRVLLRC